MGERLYLVRRQDLGKQTTSDFQRFLSSRRQLVPVGGSSMTVSLRRLYNGNQLGQVDCFRGLPVAGFSTFGELYGVNINQTLTALFFFHLGSADPSYQDETLLTFL